MKSISKWTVIGLVIAAGALLAQNPGFQRVIVAKADVSFPGREALIARIEINPGVAVGRHTHPGEEITYVIEGEMEISIDGEAPKKYKAGEGFIIPAGKIHDAKNIGSQQAKLSGVFYVEKGKPVATPAP
ncbi:MAG: cupin domain-containing protein [Bryobacterales bacterium]|nr:cupin domain-containing protein [Bryobacterales bacterium]